MRKCIAALLAIVFWIIPSVGTADPAMRFQQTTTAFQTDYEAIDQAAQSVFLLEVYDEKNQMIATGSAFVAFDSGTMITNEHVIDGASYVVAYSDQYRASYRLSNLKAVDKDKDIAILEFDTNANITPLHVDIQGRLLRGQPVTAIGSPQGVINTVSSGNISNIVYYSEEIPDYIQFTAPISPGSSGGALFNENGAVVGLCVSYLAEAEAMYYAIPMKYVKTMYIESLGRNTQTLAQYNGISMPTVTPFATPTPTPTPTLMSTFMPAPMVTPIPQGEVMYKVGDIDEEILQIKFRLYELGYYLSDSIFDNEYNLMLEWSVYLFQENHNVFANGIIDEVTYAKIYDSDVRMVSLEYAHVQTSAYSKKTYQLNEMGDEILRLKAQLMSIGYYRPNADYDNEYNDTMVDRVKLFQKNNHLQQTGIIDYITLIKLYSTGAVKGQWYVAPTPTPAPEKAITLEIPFGSYAEWNYISGNRLQFRLQVTNTSSRKIVKAYQLFLYTVDVWGNRLIPEDKVYTLDVEQTLNPGQKKYSTYINLGDANKIDRVYVAVDKVLYSDGTAKQVPKPNYTYWIID